MTIYTDSASVFSVMNELEDTSLFCDQKFILNRVFTNVKLDTISFEGENNPFCYNNGKSIYINDLMANLMEQNKIKIIDVNNKEISTIKKKKVKSDKRFKKIIYLEKESKKELFMKINATNKAGFVNPNGISF